MGAQPVDADRWVMDNPLSRKWPLYTRGNVGEVFPDVVLPLSWDLYGQAAEDGWRDAFVRLGMVADGDFRPDEPKVILGVFGGYCYINASYVRMLGLRAPGGSVEQIDMQFFGESDAPAYAPRDGDKSRRATLRLGRTLVRLLRAKDIDVLDEDRREVDQWVALQPGPDGSNEQLIGYCRAFSPLFRRLFARHAEFTFSVALVLGALFDLCVKAGHQDQLVSLLAGIGTVDSAAPSTAMWALARQAASTPDGHRGVRRRCGRPARAAARRPGGERLVRGVRPVHRRVRVAWAERVGPRLGPVGVPPRAGAGRDRPDARRGGQPRAGRTDPSPGHTSASWPPRWSARHSTRSIAGSSTRHCTPRSCSPRPANGPRPR